MSEDDWCRAYLKFAIGVSRSCVRTVRDGGEMRERESDSLLGLVKACRTYNPALRVPERSWIKIVVTQHVLDGVRKRSGHGRRRKDDFLLGRSLFADAKDEMAIEAWSSFRKWAAAARAEAERAANEESVMGRLKAVPRIREKRRWAAEAIRLMLSGHKPIEAAAIIGVSPSAISILMSDMRGGYAARLARHHAQNLKANAARDRRRAAKKAGAP